MPKIELADIAVSFGTTVDDLRYHCQEIISNTDLNYSVIDGVERDKLILDILKRIDADKQIIGDSKRQLTWEKGWRENLNDFIASNYDLNKLIPKFIRLNQPIRFGAKYIKPSNPNFELDYFKIFRLWVFKKYFAEYKNIYEFGCGTGFNLVALAKLYPEKKLYGLDFVGPPLELIQKIAQHYNYKIYGHLFDMSQPDLKFRIEKGSAIFTIGSIEQLASKFEPFMDYLLEQSISLAVHVEPVIELYDESNLVDFLAIKFQGKRGYTKTFLPYLKGLELKKVIEIVKIKRLFFGSLFMEGYNCIIWRPVER